MGAVLHGLLPSKGLKSCLCDKIQEQELTRTRKHFWFACDEKPHV